MRRCFSICSSMIAQKKETKHYLKIEDTHILIRDRGRVCVYVWVCPQVCDYFIFHGNLNGRWRPHTHTHRPLSAATPHMPCGIVIIHGVSQLLAGPDKWNYAAQMKWLHICGCMCIVYYIFVCLCLRVTRPVSGKEK